MAKVTYTTTTGTADNGNGAYDPWPGIGSWTGGLGYQTVPVPPMLGTPEYPTSGYMFDEEHVREMKEAIAKIRLKQFGDREALPHRPTGVPLIVQNALQSALTAIDLVLGTILDEKPLDTDSIFTATEEIRHAIKLLDQQ